jgi:integrase/recombinase XerD
MGCLRSSHPSRSTGERSTATEREGPAKTFLEGITELLAYLRLAGYRPATIHLYSDQLQRFGEWLRRKRIRDLRGVTRAQLLAYQLHVRGEPIRRETQALRIRAVKRLYGHLVTQGHLLLDPAEGIQEISRRQALPRPVLTPGEMKRLLAAPDVSTPQGIRDRALLEVLYATGLRVGELEPVTGRDLDLSQGLLRLNHTKGGRPRVVPLGRNAVHWLRRYLDEVRPRLVRHRPFEPALFVVRGGRGLRLSLAPALQQASAHLGGCTAGRRQHARAEPPLDDLAVHHGLPRATLKAPPTPPAARMSTISRHHGRNTSRSGFCVPSGCARP